MQLKVNFNWHCLILCAVLFLLSICELSSVTVDAASACQHVHVSFSGKNDSRIITCMTPQIEANLTTATIQWGVPTALQRANAIHINSWNEPTSNYSSTIYIFELNNLLADTSYIYQLFIGNRSSDLYSFTTSIPTTYAVYGDLGLANDMSLQQLIYEKQKGIFQAVLHVGDFAYNLNDKNGSVGDQFLSAIEPLTQNIPYMVTTGNHEFWANFSHYLNRFSGITYGAGLNSGSNTNLYYSFNVGLIHFVVIHTELYKYYVDESEIGAQLTWLRNDLLIANKHRDQQPWIIMLGHKGAWMYDRSDEIESIAHEFGVDLYFCGHQHNYNRLYPTYDDSVDEDQEEHVYTNPAYMTTIVSGSPGCEGKIDNDKTAPDEQTAFISYDYGYGHLTVFNSTHLYWQWEQTAAQQVGLASPPVQDTLWIIVDKHGMRETKTNNHKHQ